jgi:hypothetical protein
MPVDKRQMLNVPNHQTWFLSMYFSTHTLYLFLILISMAWNAYNTHQYRILNERQSKLENIITELLPSSSTILSFQRETTPIEQWFSKLFHFIQQITSKDTTDRDNNKSHTVRMMFFGKTYRES